MRFRNIILLIIVMFSGKMFAQDQFHRSYPTNMLDNLQVLDGFTSSGDSYYMLGAFLSDDLSVYDAYMLVSLDFKGNVNWQKKLEGIPEMDIGTVSGRIIRVPGAGLFYSISFYNIDTPYRLIGNFEDGGQMGIQRTYAFDSNIPPSNISLEDFKDEAFLQSGNYRSTDLKTGLYLGKTNYDDGNFQWLDAYLGSDTLNNDLTVVGTHETFRSFIDSSIVISGTGTLSHTSGLIYPYLVKFDSSGVLDWSRYYRTLTANNTNVSIFDHYEYGDTSIVVVGAISSSTFNNGFVARLDSSGQVAWAKQISQGSDVVTILDHVTPGAEGTIVSGKGLYTSRDTTFDFHLLLDDSGNVIRSAEYNPLPSFFSVPSGDLFTTANGGSAYFTTQFEDEEFVPVIIQTERDLTTLCHDTLGELSVIDVGFVADTLMWEQVAITPTIDTVEIADTSVFNFNVPILTLESVPFCPDEPIDHTFDPDVEGAVAYMWNTGDTSDTLRVMEEGDYSVTVTVADKVCFTVCDTGRISQYERPEIDMAQSLAPFCETGQVGVLFQYLMDAPIAMIEWSTGEEMASNILVSEIGTYSVTVTDICEEEAMGEIEVTEFPELITELTVDVEDDFCDDGFITLTGQADATINSAFWSNGSAGVSLLVDEPGNYTITVTDICDNPLEATGTVDPSLIVEPISALAIAPIGGDCVLSSLELNASFAGQAGSIAWSTGSNDQVTTVTDPGAYSVTVTDLCGNPVSASIDLEECPECITYPRVFFPRGEEELNRTFGPTLNCGDVITNYELKIYNRWGNLVFESNNVADEWNGQHGSDSAETGVYVYFAKYDAGDGEQMTKGDVTLIR